MSIELILKILIGSCIGVVVLFLIIWGASEIQIRVWINRVEKFLLNKSNEVKSKENEEKK